MLCGAHDQSACDRTWTHTRAHILSFSYDIIILQEGNEYRDAVFNNTVNIIEIEEGFDAET